MGSTTNSNIGGNAVKKILSILKLENKEITILYFYATLNGIIQLSLPLGIQSIISYVMASSFSTSLILLIFFVIVGVFITGLIAVKQMQLIEKIQQKIFVRYAIQYADRIPKLELKSLDSYYLPELVNRFFDSTTLQKGISKILLDFPVATIQIVFGLLLLSFYHPVFISFGFILTGLVVAMLYFSGSKGLKSSIEESDYKYKVAGWLQELARVVTSFKLSTQSSLHLQKTDKYLSGYLQARTSHFKVLMFQFWTIIGFKIIITASMLIVGSILLINQQINIGQFIGAEIVILMIINSVEKLIVNLDNVYDVLTATEKLSKLTEKPIEIQGGTQLLNQTKATAIRISQLSFQYSSNFTPLFISSFDIKSGSKVAIVGAESSGKSTLLKILSNQFSDYEGGIFLNDISLKDYDIQDYRNNIGYLTDQNEIFEGTLKDNISMGNQDFSINAIIKIANIVGINGFLEESPNGLATIINTSGKGLSRNLIQKILLMRTLIKEPPLMFLDEPWLGLGVDDAQRIQDYIFNECKNSTVLVVTNNKKFVNRCDEVIHI
jgi:ABC-type bacteriocin/lantibiotic exporter with double-glycine peptidase domain